MALSFLSGIGNTMGQMAPAVNGVSGILGLLSGIKGERDVYNAYKNQGPTASEQQSNALVQALIDPNNSLVKSLQQEDTMNSVQQFLTQIRGMQAADRRIQGRGGQPTFFEPERADDAVNFLTSRALPGLTSAGLDSARSRIATSANALRGNIPVERDRQTDAMKAMQTHTANRTNMLKGIPEIFSQIQGLFGQKNQWEDPEGQSNYEFGGYRL